MNGSAGFLTILGQIARNEQDSSVGLAEIPFEHLLVLAADLRSNVDIVFALISIGKLIALANDEDEVIGKRITVDSLHGVQVGHQRLWDMITTTSAVQEEVDTLGF